MPATDFLAEKQNEIARRLRQLQPQVDEYRRLEEAAAALAGVPAGNATSTRESAPAPRRRGPGRPKRAATSTAAAAPAAKKPRSAKPAKGKARGRRKGSGERSAQALKVVNEQPGITIPELAKRMGIKQNYLYRVLPALEGEQKVQKKGRSWYPHPKAGAAS
jgi:ribosomal protein S25